MTLIKWAGRVLCLAAAAVLLLFVAVQIQQRTLRWHAEHLSADMHQIRLYQSTWADAEQLMKRWGKWGQYQGSCTPLSCKYTITLADPGFSTSHTPWHNLEIWLLQHDRFNLYASFGGHGAEFVASFTVRDGRIWRQSSGIGLVVNSRSKRSSIYDRTLFVRAESHQRLHRTLEDPFTIMGSEEQLAEHPYYKVGRPGGCKVNCQMASISYSTQTPPREIERLTSYNFSCFTRFTPCADLGDVLPAAREWRLYDEVAPVAQPLGLLPKIKCNIPIWALARDARYVLVVQVLSAKQVKEEGAETEVAKVRVVASLKAASPWHAGTTAEAHPFSGNDYTSPPQQAEHLVPTKTFIVFPIGGDRKDQLVTQDSPIRLNRCGIQDDNSAVRRELERGFAQNDPLGN